MAESIETIKFNMPAAMPPQLPTEAPKKKKWFKRPWLLVIIVLIIAGVVYGSVSYQNNNQSPVTGNGQEQKTKVQTIVVDPNQAIGDAISTVGIVKPSSQVEVISSGKGTIKELNFVTGSFVQNNQVLVQLENSSVEESLKSAEIGLQTARDNFNNAQALQEKSRADAKNQAIVSMGSYLNTINSALNQINFIIKAEGNSQMPYIASILGVKDSQKLPAAKISYSLAKVNYQQLAQAQLTTEQIKDLLSRAVSNLSQIKQAADDTILVLEYSAPSFEFNDTALNAQKSAFTALRSSVVNTQTAAESQLQNLQNLDLINKQQIDSLQNALNFAENQLGLALIAHDNLSIKAPITGYITAKYVEMGTEVNPNQRIAQISQTGQLKIEVSLLPEDVRRLRIGQTVNLEGGFLGWLSSVEPTADFVSRKVKATILFNNAGGKLVSGTFIEVSLPAKQPQKSQANSVFIPLKALTMSQNKNFVFVVVEGKAIKKAVVVNKIEGSYIEVIEGLEQGDQIVVEGGKNLTDGQQVEVEN